jgi:hypothetical protein
MKNSNILRTFLFQELVAAPASGHEALDECLDLEFPVICAIGEAMDVEGQCLGIGLVVIDPRLGSRAAA